ncbi:MAG: hypothetical protein [Edwardsiella phage MSW-3]|nr:MAG: hypothetical protein [Edwardsiella phage MSW-3]
MNIASLLLGCCIPASFRIRVMTFLDVLNFSAIALTLKLASSNVLIFSIDIFCRLCGIRLVRGTSRPLVRIALLRLSGLHPNLLPASARVFPCCMNSIASLTSLSVNLLVMCTISKWAKVYM